jgi:hypothetical protein
MMTLRNDAHMKATHDMTKLNTINANTNTRNGGARVRNNNANTRNDERASIALKTLHNDIVRDDATFTRTTKQMRVELRAKFAHIHERNASWTFTQSQYDNVRSHFDAKYRAKIERANKRNAKSTTTKRVRKSRDAIVDVANVDVVNNDA